MLSLSLAQQKEKTINAFSLSGSAKRSFHRN